MLHLFPVLRLGLQMRLTQGLCLGQGLRLRHVHSGMRMHTPCAVGWFCNLQIWIGHGVRGRVGGRVNGRVNGRVGRGVRNSTIARFAALSLRGQGLVFVVFDVLKRRSRAALTGIPVVQPG